MNRSAEVLLASRGLVVGYRGRALLPPIDVEVHPAEIWMVLGPNGSGKTTWFRTLLGLQPPIAGRVEKVTGIAYVGQRSSFDPIFPVTVRQVVGMGLDRGWSFLKPRQDRARIEEALKTVQIHPLGDRLFRDLSEGQKQRVLLARVVASQARLVLLDEPTAAMDAVAQDEAMGLLVELRDRLGMAVVMVSHHLASAFQHADRVLYFDPDCREVVQGPPRQVLEHAAFHSRFGEAAEDIRHEH